MQSGNHCLFLFILIFYICKEIAGLEHSKWERRKIQNGFSRKNHRTSVALVCNFTGVQRLQVPERFRRLPSDARFRRFKLCGSAVHERYRSWLQIGSLDVLLKYEGVFGSFAVSDARARIPRGWHLSRIGDKEPGVRRRRRTNFIPANPAKPAQS